MRKNLMTLSLAILLIAAVSIYIYKDLSRTSNLPLTQTENNSKNLPISVETGQSGQNYKVEVIDNKSQKSLEEGPKMPDLSRNIVNYGHINEASFENAAKNIADLTKGLQTEPKSEAKWFDLSSFRKMIGDYEGSLEILNYLAILWPNDYVVFNNLGNLHQFYLKNYPLAEKNWLKVIALRADYLEAYENLYGLYKDLYKEKQGEALPILLKGLENNPKSIGLMVYIARHYQSDGESEQAKIYYDKAITEAQAENNKQLEASLRSEASKISQ